MDSEDMIHRYTHIHTVEYYPSIIKNEVLLLATTWVDLEGIIMLSEVSQTEEDKHYMILLTRGIF